MSNMSPEGSVKLVPQHLAESRWHFVMGDENEASRTGRWLRRWMVQPHQNVVNNDGKPDPGLEKPIHGHADPMMFFVMK